jgi:beta-phosphoglucomutase
MIKAVVFDLDGVITDTAELHYQAWKKLAESLDIYFDRTINESLKGVDRMGSLDAILGQQKNAFSQQAKMQLADRKNRHYQSLIRSLSPKDILPGITELLSTISHGGLHIGMASASKNAPAVVDSLGLTDAFEFIADAHLVKRSKPHPEVFQMVLDHFQLNGQSCIGIEDAHAGVQAINSAGMFSVGIGESSVLSNANLVYPDTQSISYDEMISFAS